MAAGLEPRATVPGNERIEAGWPRREVHGGSPPIEKGDEGAFDQQLTVPLVLAGGSRPGSVKEGA
jgi:hypothetical protein